MIMSEVENQNKEFKLVWNDNCLKTICAFANTGGGNPDAPGTDLSKSARPSKTSTPPPLTRAKGIT
jgi:hypothetical protein